MTEWKAECPGAFRVVDCGECVHVVDHALAWGMAKRANEELDRLRARIAELEASQAWRPMSEAPRDRTEVLLATVGGEIHIGLCHGSGWWSADDLIGHREDMAGWMPLPALPEVVT